MEGKRSRARVANGIVAGILVVFFFAIHGFMGSLSTLLPISTHLSWIAWIFTALIVVHIALDVRVTYEKLNNPEKPPTPEKIRKIALRWATGVLLGIAVCVHVWIMVTLGSEAARTTPTGVASIIALIVLLAAHVCLCVKSLVRDLGASKELKDRLTVPLRCAICLIAGVFCIIALVVYLG